jgi:hypothetical protein
MRAALLTTIALLGCTSVLDVDRFKEQQASQPSNVVTSQFLDLELTLIGMKPHVAHTYEYRVVDANNLVQSRGVVAPLGAADVKLFVPRAIPRSNGPYRLDFYADVNESGGFDGIGSVISNDHAWRIEPLVDYPAGAFKPVEGRVQVSFTHSTSFTNIDNYPSGTPNKAKDTGLGVVVKLASLEQAAGKMLEVRVAEQETKHVVGLLRVPAVASPTLDVKIPGVVDVGVDYFVDVYIDSNANGAYDDPSKEGGDWGIRSAASSTEAGLTHEIDVASEPHAVDIGSP